MKTTITIFNLLLLSLIAIGCEKDDVMPDISNQTLFEIYEGHVWGKATTSYTGESGNRVHNQMLSHHPALYIEDGSLYTSYRDGEVCVTSNLSTSLLENGYNMISGLNNSSTVLEFVNVESGTEMIFYFSAPTVKQHVKSDRGTTITTYSEFAGAPCGLEDNLN